MRREPSMDLRCCSARCFCGFGPGCCLLSIAFPEVLVGSPSSPDILGGKATWSFAATKSQLWGDALSYAHPQCTVSIKQRTQTGLSDPY